MSLSGDGNVLEPENKNIASVGSGSVYALSSARALYENTDFDAETIVRKAMKIAGDMCIYTNHNLSIEKITVGKKDVKNKIDKKQPSMYQKVKDTKSTIKKAKNNKKKQNNRKK